MLVGIDVAAKPSTKCDEIISERNIIAFIDEAYSQGMLLSYVSCFFMI